MCFLIGWSFWDQIFYEGVNDIIINKFKKKMFGIPTLDFSKWSKINIWNEYIDTFFIFPICNWWKFTLPSLLSRCFTKFWDVFAISLQNRIQPVAASVIFAQPLLWKAWNYFSLYLILSQFNLRKYLVSDMPRWLI